ncbi:MAG: HIT family protein [Chromatiaceae bacterium]|nr:MAG: HIT family protein [Chromatiaceae bacterium]
MKPSDTNLKNDGECRFCVSKPGRRLMLESEHGFAAYDLHPVSPGHYLVIPYRHFASYFDIQDAELVDLWGLVARGKDLIEEQYHPDGYNIGINVGHWAGQSIHHLHIHVIPRYRGDVENPKGGVRGVIPHKKLYQLSTN